MKQGQFHTFQQQIHHLQLRVSCLTYLAIQFFLTALYLTIGQIKNQLYQSICQRTNFIYLAIAVLSLSFVALKKNAVKHQLINRLLLIALGLSMGWCVTYLINYFHKSYVLNLVMSVFASILGLRIYTGSKHFEIEEGSNSPMNLYGSKNEHMIGVFSSCIGTVLALNLMSYTFVEFDLYSTAIAIVLSIWVSISITKNMKSVIKELENSQILSPSRGVALIYENILLSAFMGLAVLVKKVVSLEWL